MEIVSPDIFRRLSEEAISGSRNIAEESGSIQGILAAVSPYNYSDLEDDLAGGIYTDKKASLLFLMKLQMSAILELFYATAVLLAQME